MTKGPIDELFPGWRDRRPDTRPIHARVLEEPIEGGDVAFVIVVWRDPGGAAALHAAMRPVIESTLLAELSRPPADLVLEEGRRPTTLRVLVYDSIEGTEDAFRAFGLVRRPDTGLDACFAHVRGEASAQGFEVDTPLEVWEATFARAEGVDDFESAIRARMGERVFGTEPGALFASINQVFEALGREGLPPRASSLDVLEALFVPNEEGRVRWIPTVLFQTICDAVGVCAAKDLKRDVQWGLSEKEDDGLAPPPLIRLKDGSGWAHVPLGRDLMRWCVMPRQVGENVPPLSAWLNDRFGG